MSAIQERTPAVPSRGRAPLLQVEGLQTRFESKRGLVHAVNGVSFTVEEGQLVGVVGESGCGKSVTARSVLGLIQPPGKITGGSVKLDGRELVGADRRLLREVRGGEIGFIPQNPFGALNPILSIERQFRNVIRTHETGVSKAQARERALEMLRGVGIAGPERVLDGYAHQLSGGMAQRVVIAIALSLNPRMVIADEPTTGLDVTVQRQILDMVLSVLEANRRSMLLVTHDLGIVAQYCHRVIVMYAGKVVETGTVQEVFKHPAHPYTEALLGAVPRSGHDLVSLRGTVPNLVDYPTGCPFEARCAYAGVHGRADEAPELRELSPGRGVSCHLKEGVSGHLAHTS
jgi:oligopeptide/dipeptide ABC transporter ATP-binding protein